MQKIATRKKRTIWSATLCVTLGFSLAAQANPWKDPLGQLRKSLKVDKRATRFYQHALGNKNFRSFGLILQGQESLDRALATFLKEDILNPAIELHQRANKFPLRGVNPTEAFSRDYQFRVSGVPICDFQLRAHKLAGVPNPVIMGSIPQVEPGQFDPSEWPDPRDVNEIAANGLAEKGYDISGLAVNDASRCLYLADGRLRPSWNMVVMAGNLPYRVIADDYESYQARPMFMHTTGSAKVYEKNPTDGTLKTFTLNDLTGDGSLENQWFTTSTTGTKANESSHTFEYDSSDGRFAETSLFVHVNTQYEYFRNLGHNWQGSDKLNLIPHSVIQGSVNNALYTPAFSNNAPKIQVGDGDGVRLQNLTLDSDVVSHELGHHIVYETLQTTDGESLVIHEGLADYFTFARTDNPCLGESICPSGSSVGCEVDGQCLRSADPGVKYVLNENTKSDAHFKSQFISGMLWGLRGQAIPSEELDKIVFRGMQLLNTDSGYHDLILGFLLADKEQYEQKHCQTLYDAAKDRGLSDAISDFDCSNLPAIIDKSSATTDASSTTSKDDANSLLPFCGISTSTQQPGQNMLVLLLLALPFLFGCLHARRREH